MVSLDNSPERLKRRKAKKKKKSRTLNFSSDSDSDGHAEKRSKEEKGEIGRQSPTASEASRAKKEKEEKRKSPVPRAVANGSSIGSAETPSETQEPARHPEDFDSIYLRKVATELADDLDKVRAASDFTEKSIVMLRHALVQGTSIFSAEEKKRVLGGVNL